MAPFSSQNNNNPQPMLFAGVTLDTRMWDRHLLVSFFGSLIVLLSVNGASFSSGSSVLDTNAVDDADGTAGAALGDYRDGRAGGAGGAARAILGEIARELISRSATSSQVLSLNLTNLVILLVLKAIIFGAGTMGLGWAGKGRSASSDQPHKHPLVSEQEALLLLGFLMGDMREPDGYQCLQRVACQEPESAYSYARAALLLSKGAKMLQGVLPYDDKFDDVVGGLTEAVEYGRDGGKCDTKYSCSKK